MAITGELSGQLAVVTGASGTIGGAIAVELGQQGAFVVGTSQTMEGAGRIDEALAEAEVEGLGVKLDLTNPDKLDFGVKQLIEYAEARMTRIEENAGNLAVSILVNNAGITRDGLSARMDRKDWQDVLDIDLSGAFYLTQAVMRGMMKAKYGRVVNVGSVVGLSGNPGQANYAAAKAGLIGMSKSLAKELASRNITVNVVAPGYVESDMTNILPQEAKDTMVDHTPIKRPITPEEVAHAVTFLASPRASAITGEVIRVDGGLAA